MENSLQTILTSINKNKAIVKAEVQEGEPTSRNAHDRKKAAKTRIEEFKVEYRNALLARTVFIIMYGPEAGNLAKIAAEDFGSFTTNAENVFERIANEIPTQLYSNKPSSPSLFDHISHVLEGVAAEAGVDSFASPKFKSSRDSRMLTSKEDLLRVIKNIITDQIGSEMIAIHAVTATFLQALEAEFDGKVYPVVLFTPDIEYAGKLVRDINKHMEKETFMVTTEGTPADRSTIVLKDVTKESVKSALTSIKKSLGGKK